MTLQWLLKGSQAEHSGRVRLMVRPTGWDILGLDGDPTPGVVKSVQALAKEFGDFAHDVEARAPECSLDVRLIM